MKGFLVVLLFMLIAGCDGFRSLSDTEYVSRAEQYLDEGELISATIELKNALTQNPKNPQARWLLGKIYLDVGNFPGAEKEFLQARELGVIEQSVVPLLAKALLAQKKYQDVLSLKGTAFSDQAASDLLTARGLAYLAQQDQDDAEIEFKSAIRRNPNSSYTLVGIARLEIAKKNFSAAQAFLDKVFSTDEDYGDAWTLQGDLKYLENDPEGAIAAYSQAIEKKYRMEGDLLKRAFVYVQNEQLVKAQADIDQVIERLPKKSGVNYVQGLIYFKQGQFSKAQESFENVIQANPQNLRAVFLLGTTHYLTKNYTQSEFYLSTFVDSYPAYIPGRKLLAIIKLREKDFSKVEELMRPVVLKRKDDVEALNLFAKALLGMGETEEAMRLLREVVKLEPESAGAKKSLGVGLILAGEEDQGLKVLEEAIQLDPQLKRVDSLLILKRLEENSLNKAFDAAQSYLERQPDDPLAHNLLGIVYLALNQEEKAVNAFEKARFISPGDPTSSVNLASIAVSKKQFEKARKFYLEILRYHKDNITALLKLAELEARSGDFKAMESLLLDAIERNPETIRPRVLLAQEYLRHGKIDLAYVALGDAKEKHRDNPDILAVLGELQLNNKQFSDAEKTFQRLVELHPRSPQAHYLLARAFGGSKKNRQMMRELEETLNLDSNHVQARLALTRFQILAGNTKDAEKNLTLMVEESGGNSEVLLLQGLYHDRLGKKDDALKVYQKLLLTSPSSESVSTLAEYLWELDQKEESIVKLEQWLAEHKEDVDVRLLLAKSYVGFGRRLDAISQYKEVLKYSESNVLALNNLAWYLKETDTQQALEYGERANSIAPESTIVLDTLASVLIKSGENERASRMIERGLARKPDSPTLLFRQVELLAAKGEREEASSKLKLLLTKHQAFPERSRAVSLLQQYEAEER